MSGEGAVALKGSFTELARLAAETARFCREHGLDGDVEFDLNLALEELFTNVVRHGGCEGMAEAARVRFEMLADGVGIEFADRGAPFDPLAAPTPDLEAPLENRRPGGLGIHLVRQIMRDLRYDRADGWNRLTMRRPIPGEGLKG
ncbi:MAG TPA: ATP-binding protein [Candidatus Binataceae bacterium]|nr:ATP-binding protein [Candidatus Binataceae bacterium]